MSRLQEHQRSYRLTAPPDVVRYVSRSGDHGDCAVAALAMACGVTYEVALQACVEVCPPMLEGGMHWAAIKRAASRLGFKATTVPFERLDFSDEDMTGILEVVPTQRGSKENHVVYVWRGRIIEPKADRQELWDDPEMFFSHYKYRVARLLQVIRHE